MDDEYTLQVEREDGELLVLDGLGLVRGFLAGDLSARSGGYNDQAGRGDREAISPGDVRLVNTTMRARAEHVRWKSIIEADQRWLAHIPDDLDLIETNDDAWTAAQGDRLINEAIARCIVPYIGLARSTKVLHLKRPRAFPRARRARHPDDGRPGARRRRRAHPGRTARDDCAASRGPSQHRCSAADCRRHRHRANAARADPAARHRALARAPASGVDGTLRKITVAIR